MQNPGESWHASLRTLCGVALAIHGLGELSTHVALVIPDRELYVGVAHGIGVQVCGRDVYMHYDERPVTFRSSEYIHQRVYRGRGGNKSGALSLLISFAMRRRRLRVPSAFLASTHRTPDALLPPFWAVLDVQTPGLVYHARIE